MDKEKLRGMAILEVGNKIKTVDLPTFTETFDLLYEVLTKQNSHKHVVMQAEGSDVSEGAAVASEGLGEANMCADCGRTKDEDGTCYSCEYGAMFGH